MEVRIKRRKIPGKIREEQLKIHLRPAAGQHPPKAEGHPQGKKVLPGKELGEIKEEIKKCQQRKKRVRAISVVKSQ